MSYKRNRKRHGNHWRKRIDRDEEKIRKPDVFDEILANPENADISTIVKTYAPDREKQVAQQWRYPDEAEQPERRMNPDGTHYIGYKNHPHNHSIAKSLLNIAGYKSHVGPLAPPLEHDDRPLIDLLHEATFTNPIGLASIRDSYALRMLLRKAHCFTLDETTSAMIADFSMATLSDLEACRYMTIPPFPITWIELDNSARLDRLRQLGAPLRDDVPDNPPTDRIGWLIHPSQTLGGWYATVTRLTDIGIWIAPLSYWWHAGAPNPELKPSGRISDLIEWLLFGTAGNVNGYDAHMHASDLHVGVDLQDVDMVKDAMADLAGELRHVWGFLIALGAGHLGASAQYTSQAAPTRSPPIMKNGKPLLPLEHKVLHLHLNKKTPAKIVAQAITHHHNRRHDVRAHWRQLKSGKRVPVASHQRGDEKLGRIEKTYRVER